MIYIPAFHDISTYLTIPDRRYWYIACQIHFMINIYIPAFHDSWCTYWLVCILSCFCQFLLTREDISILFLCSSILQSNIQSNRRENKNWTENLDPIYPDQARLNWPSGLKMLGLWFCNVVFGEIPMPAMLVLIFIGFTSLSIWMNPPSQALLEKLKRKIFRERRPSSLSEKKLTNPHFTKGFGHYLGFQFSGQV